jgi:uncharacterized protein DUF4136
MKIARIILGLSLLLIAGNVFGQKVTTQSAPNVNWSQYKTYSWGKSESEASPIMNQFIANGIDAQLAAKGFSKVEQDGDLTVIFNVSTDTEKQLNWSSMGGFGRWGGGMGSASVDKITQGQLIVDLVDPKAKQFLWRGTGSDTVSDNPQKNEKKVTTALNKMFQKFPAGK